MCWYLDREERIRMFSALTEWHSTGGLAVADGSNQEKKRIFQHLAGRFLPTPVRNVFQARNSLCSATTAFQLRQKPNLKDISLENVQLKYEVPNFIDDLRRYFLGPKAQHFTHLPFDVLSTWWRVQIQLKDPQDPGVLLPPQTIQASPQVKTDKAVHFGRYNFVLIRDDATCTSDIRREDYGIRGNFFSCVLLCAAD